MIGSTLIADSIGASLVVRTQRTAPVDWADARATVIGVLDPLVVTCGTVASGGSACHACSTVIVGHLTCRACPARTVTRTKLVRVSANLRWGYTYPPIIGILDPVGMTLAARRKICRVTGATGNASLPVVGWYLAIPARAAIPGAGKLVWPSRVGVIDRRIRTNIHGFDARLHRRCGGVLNHPRATRGAIIRIRGCGPTRSTVGAATASAEFEDVSCLTARQSHTRHDVEWANLQEAECSIEN